MPSNLKSINKEPNTRSGQFENESRISSN